MRFSTGTSHEKPDTYTLLCKDNRGRKISVVLLWASRHLVFLIVIVHRFLPLSYHSHICFIQVSWECMLSISISISGQCPLSQYRLVQCSELQPLQLIMGTPRLVAIGNVPSRHTIMHGERFMNLVRTLTICNTLNL